jgi:protocatechuate 3,4-dioxygenase alpha subunit
MNPPQLSEAEGRLDATASQTVGPFFHIGLTHLRRDHVLQPVRNEAPVTVRGRVLDGSAAPIRDVAIELWQAGADGTYDRVGARGFGRIYPDDDGNFTFSTIRPGAVPGPAQATQAPHLVVTLFMRGLLKQLMTRMYFPDDHRNATDPILALVPPERRETLIAHPADAASSVLHWDVVLQGDGETVFFEC